MVVPPPTVATQELVSPILAPGIGLALIASSLVMLAATSLPSDPVPPPVAPTKTGEGREVFTVLAGGRRLSVGGREWEVRGRMAGGSREVRGS